MENIIRGAMAVVTTAYNAASAGSPIKGVKRMIFWNPVLLAASSLPALAFYPVQSHVYTRGVATDQMDATFKVKLIQNMKDYLNDWDDTNQLMEQTAMRIFEERDGTSFDKIKNTSIIGALRNDYTLQYQAKPTCNWNGDYQMSYEYVNMDGWVAFETTLTITVKKISDRF